MTDAKYQILESKFAPNAPSADWSVAVAFRNVTSTDSYRLQLQTALTCGTMAHVDLLIKAKCGGKMCSRRGPGYIENGDHSATKTHVLAYSIRTTKDNNTVSCAVEPAFHKYSGWSFVGLKVDHEQANNIDKFMRSQLGRPYNQVGFDWNPLYGRLGYPYGVKFEDVIPGSSFPKKASWFCSELVCAALVYGGVIDNSINRDPCTTTPQDLFNYCNALDISYPVLHSDMYPKTKPASTATAAMIDMKE